MRVSLVAVALVALTSSVVNAQERRGGGEGFDPAAAVDRVLENDKDGDEKISKDEADERTLRMFARVDTDEDGFLTRDELEKAMERRGGGGSGEGRGGPGEGRGGPGEGRGGGIARMVAMMPIVKALDKNGDGELSEEEIAGAVLALKTLDKDENGSISTEEMSPDMSQMFGGRGGEGGGPGGRGGEGRGAEGRGGEGGARGAGERPRRPRFEDEGDGKKRKKKDGQ